MFRRVLLLTVVSTMLASCGSSNDEIVISEMWGRPSPATAQAAAFYMEISNPSDSPDTLVSATSPVCDAVELHQSVLDDAQVMSMSQLENGIALEKDSTVVLEPGGVHIMCIGLDHELAAGEMVAVQLQFENAPVRDIEVEIRAN